MSKLIVIIKPWSIQHTDNILTELDKYGTRLQTTKIEQIKLEDIALHYIAHKQRINYQDMIQDFEGLTLTLALYEGDYTTLNKLKKEIREKYSHDIPLNPNHLRNALHISGSNEEFIHELSVWQKYLI